MYNKDSKMKGGAFKCSVSKALRTIPAARELLQKAAHAIWAISPILPISQMDGLS